MEKTDKKTDILKAAEKLFSALGYDATTTRQIAKESKANMAMINYYFGGKEGVFEEVISNRIADFKVHLHAIGEEKIPVKEKLLKVVQQYVSRIFDHISFHKMMQRELSLSQRPETYTKIKEAMMSNLLVIEKIIEQGIIEKQFRPVDIRMLIATMMGTISNVAVSPGKVMNNPDFDMNIKAEREKLKLRVVVHLQSLLMTYLAPDGAVK